MFDMNLLWEQFVYVSLRKKKPPEKNITAQSAKPFWKPVSGYKQSMKPDIVINKEKENCIILDTKWKNLNGRNPSPEDLRQLYVYSKFHNNAKAILIYPGDDDSYQEGHFYDELSGTKTNRECGVMTIKSDNLIRRWQQRIAENIFQNQISEK